MWQVLYEHDRTSIMEHIGRNTDNILPICKLERKPTAKESMNDWYTLVPEIVAKGVYKGNTIPKNTLVSNKDLYSFKQYSCIYLMINPFYIV